MTKFDFYPITRRASPTERSVRDGELDLATNPSSPTGWPTSAAPAWRHICGSRRHRRRHLPDVQPARSGAEGRSRSAGAVDGRSTASSSPSKLLRGGQTAGLQLRARRAWTALCGGAQDSTGPDWTFAQRQAEARAFAGGCGLWAGPSAASGDQASQQPRSAVVHARRFSPTGSRSASPAELQQNDVQVAYQEYELHDFQVGDAGWQSKTRIGLPRPRSRQHRRSELLAQYNNPAYDRELDAAVNSVDPASSARHAARPRRPPARRRADRAALLHRPAATWSTRTITGWHRQPARHPRRPRPVACCRRRRRRPTVRRGAT